MIDDIKEDLTLLSHKLSPAQFASLITEAVGEEYAQMVQAQLVMKLIEK